MAIRHAGSMHIAENRRTNMSENQIEEIVSNKTDCDFRTWYEVLKTIRWFKAVGISQDPGGRNHYANRFNVYEQRIAEKGDRFCIEGGLIFLKRRDGTNEIGTFELSDEHVVGRPSWLRQIDVIISILNRAGMTKRIEQNESFEENQYFLTKSKICEKKFPHHIGNKCHDNYEPSPGLMTLRDLCDRSVCQRQ